MAEIGLKRKATRSLVADTKRMRIEVSEANFIDGDDEVDEDDENYSSNRDNDDTDNESHGAETPLTPFSPARRFRSDEKTIKCTYEGCLKTFNRPARLASHLRSHKNERPFVCNYTDCDKSYIEEKHLKQHIKGSHTHEREYTCDWEGCTKSFMTATRLRRHRDTHAGHDRFRCTEYPPCNQSFRKHQTLQRHIRSDHLELAPFPCTQIDTNTGEPCGAGFDSGGALRKHEDRIHGSFRYFCDDCTIPGPNGLRQPLGFTTKPELTKHIKATHIKCIFCDFPFTSQQSLQQHIEAQHNGKSLDERRTRPCTVPGCGKSFTKKYNLDVHIRTVHKGERFTCGTSDLTNSTAVRDWDGSDACGADFVSKQNLEDHIRTRHLGLSSLVNAKRTTKTKLKGKSRKSAQAESESESEEDNAIDFLTGAMYDQDDARNIPCVVPGCAWLFTRDYDLDQHLRLRHSLSQPEINAATQAPQHSQNNTQPQVQGQYNYNDRTHLDQLYQQADLDWELQQRASEGGPFWIGADCGNVDGNMMGDSSQLGTPMGLRTPVANVGPQGQAQGEGEWVLDETEMRRLIDEIQAGMEGVDNVDPALVGL